MVAAAARVLLYHNRYRLRHDPAGNSFAHSATNTATHAATYASTYTPFLATANTASAVGTS